MILRIFFSLCLAGTVQAQVPTDSLIHYELGDIVVRSSGESPSVSSISTMQQVRLAGIAQADAASIDPVLRQIPSAHLQTNSRGESLIYLRGAGERQVSLFFDGALLNIPWDNRIDLSLIPSEVVGEISIAKGVPSVLYGANVLGGAINLTSRQLRNPGSFSQLSGIFGSYGSRQARMTWLRRTERFQSTVFVGGSDQDGFRLPQGADLPYSQDSNDLRTNTDRRMRSAFGQFSFKVGEEGSVGLSLLRFDGKKGIAPEGHVDPGKANVRYWRYPDWGTNMAILSGQFPFLDGTLRGAAWAGRFGQTIAQYSDKSYSEQVETQIDEDDTYGARLTYLRDFPNSGSLRAAINLLSSTHKQEDIEAQGPSLYRVFSQRILSNGIEYTRSGFVNVMIGASVDVLATPRTGDKPERGPQTGLGVTMGLSNEVYPGVTIRGVIGRKTRFPTMRELFGEALGRFLVNPDLKPESSLLTEAAIGIERGETAAEAIAFFNRTYNTIGQEMVLLEGETRARRKRVNLEGSRVLGIEATISSRVFPSLLLGCSLTGMRASELNPDGSRPLIEKPSWIGRCNMNYRFGGGISVVLESAYSGQAYGLGEDNQQIALPNSLVTNARIAWLLLYRGYSAELFIRINNITDEVVLPQLGLPGPGRTLHMGLQVTF